MEVVKRVLWGLGAVCISALLLVLALPPADVYPLGFVALVPLFLAVRGRGFAVGFAGGMGVLMFGAFVTQQGWFFEPSILDGDPGWNFAGFALFGLVVGLTTALLGETKRIDRWTPWLIAAWAVVFEAALLVYLPTHLGLTQYRQFPAMMVASFAGIWAVSYFVWVVNVVIVLAIQERKRRTLVYCGVALGLYLGLCAIVVKPQEGDLVVGVIQTASKDLDELAALNGTATAEGAEIVVWPELSGLLAAYGGDSSELVALASEGGQSPFITSFEDDATPLPFNVAAVFSSAGESERYKKRKPFGGERYEHAAGEDPVKATVDGVTYGLNICFDSCFPSVMRDTVRLEGVEVILLPTLDPVAPFGTVQAYHSAYTTFRAAELGVPIVRADTTAYSMVVDARGVIVGELGSGTEEVMVVGIEPQSLGTVYKRLGDWFLYFCFLVCIAGLAVGRKKRTRAKESD